MKTDPSASAARVLLDGTVLRDGVAGRFSVDCAAGESIAVIGPNGAGKTTLLRTIAGFEPLHDGRLLIGEHVVDEPESGSWSPPHQRPATMLFQEPTLLGHLNVVDNIAFALTTGGGGRRRAARSTAKAQLLEAELGHLAQRRPHELSGGERQRIATIQSLAAEPSVLLIDEPTSALDVHATMTAANSIRGLDQTVLVVTHDPALTQLVADRILVIQRTETAQPETALSETAQFETAQLGTLDEVRSAPCNPWVADFLGLNLLSGTASGTSVMLESGALAALADPADGAVHITFPANAVVLSPDPPTSSARNVWQVRVTSINESGARIRVGLEGEIEATAEITGASLAGLALTVGSRCWASVKATELRALTT